MFSPLYFLSCISTRIVSKSLSGRQEFLLKHKVYNAATYIKKRTQVSLFEQYKDVYLY